MRAAGAIAAMGVAVAVAMRSEKLLLGAAAAELAAQLGSEIRTPTAGDICRKSQLAIVGWLPDASFTCFHQQNALGLTGSAHESHAHTPAMYVEGPSDGACGEHVGFCGRAFGEFGELGMHKGSKR